MFATYSVQNDLPIAFETVALSALDAGENGTINRSRLRPAVARNGPCRSAASSVDGMWCRPYSEFASSVKTGAVVGEHVMAPETIDVYLFDEGG